MTQNPIFKPQEVKRAKSKASILVEGLSGSGKSGLALILGKALTKDWGKVCVIDTENRSIPLFEGVTASTGDVFQKFKVSDFSVDLGYKPSNYLAFKEGAIEDGAEVVISDSISHAWSYEGGILDLLTKIKVGNIRYQKDSYAAWGDPQIVAEKNKLFQLLRDTRVHVICTVRVKEKMEYGTDETTGKSTLVSLGEQQIMQEGMKYEPDLVLKMLSPGTPAGKPPKVTIIKSRYAIFSKGQEYEFTAELAEQLRKYLEEGTSPEELLAEQHKEYAEGVNTYLKSHKNAIPIWKVLCKDLGYEDQKAADIPLEDLKQIFINLTID